MSTRYYLAPHVYACATKDYAILLDVKRDKYLAVTGSDSAALASLVVDWPVTTAGRQSEASAPVTPNAGVLAELRSLGMIASDGDPDRYRRTSALPIPTQTLAYAEFDRRVHISIHHVAHFFACCARASALLRFAGLESVVRRVCERKARLLKARPAVDWQRTCDLVSAFLSLRPFLFTRNQACLFDSLALIEFLARYGAAPDWVVGVQSVPFAAHSWVQQGVAVFNDVPEYVRRFTPILVI